MSITPETLAELQRLHAAMKTALYSFMEANSESAVPVHVLQEAYRQAAADFGACANAHMPSLLDELEAAKAERDRLRDAAKTASAMLKVPAAEYVPAMSDAWSVLDAALGGAP